MSNQSYNQLCVWQGVTLASTTPEQFEKDWKEMGFRVKFSEEVKRVGSNQSILLFLDSRRGRNAVCSSAFENGNQVVGRCCQIQQSKRLVYR